ncbi:hypothetical protein M758_6G153200 [Ceratodon purpureus]|uniref:Uncharacterized protein n=1 Tax=Ceratodon purpureus TaxID=3225 RepID=A0A8T0HGF0_CERPU|nr:hypothetical protein KC19_6G158600 [Ceratodon purpureus]KAG0614135.1 hypothetical protein M758_6G153200 [Ceratodon purpureus]
MPGLLPMRSLGAASKARSSGARNLARAKGERGREEGGAGVGTTLVRVPSQNVNISTMGLLSAQFATVNRAKGTELGAEVRSKLFGNGVDVENRFGNQYVSSGSEHELNSVCLGAMVDGFIENDSDGGRCGRSRCNCQMSGSSLCDCSDFDDSRSSLGGELSEILQDMVSSINVTERILLGEVEKATAKAKDAASDEDASSCLKRQVMKHLRTGGYNAAICKSRWDHAGSFPGGDYEYIDVVFEGATGKSERIIIDIDFRAQFEIARPTVSYNAVVQVLPTVFIGKVDRLLQIVNIMSDAVKLSLKKRGMPLPPWRKPEYMRAKWFSSYRRTTNDTVHKNHSKDISNISRIAVRDGGWNAKFTDEMEVDYLRGGERRVMKDLKNLVDKRPTEVGNRAATDVPTKVVVDNSEWTPPALKPRVFQRPGQAGLASILREAGLTSSIRSLIEEQRAERKSSSIAV